MISVCMATYNGERFLREQIDSILCQLAPDDELIISDDGSTDGTLEIIESYKDKRIRLFFHEKKDGNKYYMKSNVLYATKNFENALKYAVGDYIFLSDQDDIWYENKVTESINFLKKYDFVMSNFSVVNETGVMEKDSFYEKNPIKNIFKTMFKAHFIGCCCCFKQNILNKSLPFSDGIYSHDLWLGLIGLKNGKVGYIENPLIKHRVGFHNNSTACKKSQNTILFRIKYRILTLLELLKRT